MKVTIIDIELPERCVSCPIHNSCENADYAIKGDDGEIIPLKDRPSNCPLKEVEIPDEKVNSHLSEIKEIVEYLNLATGASYRASTPKTQRLICARMREGFTVEDFKLVIDHKLKAWGKDPKMQTYLRPETLFGTKFECYLNERCTSRIGENSFQRMQRLAREGAFDE